MSTTITDLLHEQCRTLAQRARIAARPLAIASGAAKNEWLLRSAHEIGEHAEEILAANAIDLERAPAFGQSIAAIDRLRLTHKRLSDMAQALRDVAALPDPVGEVIASHRRPNGLDVTQRRVPLGVIFMIFESRPNVTADAAALCVKSGNAVILRGGKEAFYSNQAIAKILTATLGPSGLPEDSVQMVANQDRDVVGQLLTFADLIDLVIPRGGESLIRRVVADARMPVLKHYDGVCHVYVDASADLEMATNIIINSKVQRPGVCNALETILIHKSVAKRYLHKLAAVLDAKGVEIRGDEATVALVPQARPADPEDWDTEYLDLIVSIKIVEDFDDALDHIDRHGSKHTDAIVTRELEMARRFVDQVDSAAVVVNASTRFNDGGQLGLGAEIGISTDKFHARGPCGLRELTTTKWVIVGNGQTRV